MKKLLSILFIFLIYSLGQTAKAQVVPITAIVPMIKAEQLKELQLKGYNEVEVNILNIPIANFRLPDGQISLKINSNSNNLVGREYKKIDIYVNSKYQRSFGAPVEIKIFQNVLVAKEPIIKDTLLTSKNIELKKYNILSLIQNTLDEKALSKEIIATKMYRTGEVIDRRFSKAKPDIVKNATVTVIFKTDDEMAITVDGIALVEGSVGNSISVQNKTYKKVYIGKVIGPNKVLVEI